MNSSDFPSEHTSRSTAPNKAGPQKSKWSLNQAAWDKLLSCFSSDREEAGVQYERTRRKLVRFFEWRAVELAEDHADRFGEDWIVFPNAAHGTWMEAELRPWEAPKPR